MQILYSSVFVAAAKLHPDCNFVMLTDHATPGEFFLPDMWLGRLEVRFCPPRRSVAFLPWQISPAPHTARADAHVYDAFANDDVYDAFY